MQGRDRCLLNPATAMKGQKYAVYHTLPLLKTDTVFADCLKGQFSISFSEEMVGLFDFLFVSRLFLGVTFSKISKNRVFKFLISTHNRGNYKYSDLRPFTVHNRVVITFKPCFFGESPLVDNTP